MKNIELIKATEKDKEFLLSLRKLTMEQYFLEIGINLSEEENRKRVDSFFEDSYIIWKNNKKIGLLKYTNQDSKIEIIQLQILSKYQKKGIGSTILMDIILLAETENKKLILKVLKNNPSITLYKRKGFEIIGEDEHEFHMEFKK